MKEETVLLEIKINEAENAAKIVVIGVGGAGNNVVNRMVKSGTQPGIPPRMRSTAWIRIRTAAF